MRKVYVVQRPRELDHFDMPALEALGEVIWVLPWAPALTDPEKLKADFQRLLDAVENATDEDVFVCLGGSPISNALFGAAIYASGKHVVQMGMYSRDVDTRSGARKLTGSYRIVPMSWLFADEERDAA
jgi:hypothetical protein